VVSARDEKEMMLRVLVVYCFLQKGPSMTRSVLISMQEVPQQENRSLAWSNLLVTILAFGQVNTNKNAGARHDA
jgi:hypothetical protein